MKRISALILAICLASPVFAGDQQKQTYSIADFSKGLNSQTSPYAMPETMATEATNVRLNNGFRGVAKRPSMLTALDCGSNSIVGLHRFYKSDGTKKTLITSSTKLYVGDDDAGTCSEIRTGLTDGKHMNFVTYKDKAIGMNGYDRPIKYDGNLVTTSNTDGARTAGDSATELGAPFAELNTGSNLDASSWYIYKVAFYDGSTYSYTTAKSNPILTGSSVRDILLTDIPLGPSGTTQRIIYRTSGNASRAAAVASSTYYKVATISNNTATTYADAITDTTIEADAAPTYATVSSGTNITAPLGVYPYIHEERLFIAGNQTNKSDLYWSDTYNPDYFNPVSYVQIRPDDGDAITFLKEQLGILVVGKTTNILKFYTTSTDETEWYADVLNNSVGCPAPHSAANTPKGIIYLGRGGLYLFNGQYSSLISDAVTPEIEDILATNIDDCAGFYFKNEYYLAYPSASSGHTVNNRVLVYDMIRDAYAKDIKNVNVFTAYDSGSDYGILYLGSSADDGKVYADEGSPSVLVKRYKSEFDAGTYSDTANYGIELEPTIELAWSTTIDSWTGGIINDIGGIIDRPDTNGTWTSPIYQIDAKSLELLSWNEALNGVGDVTFAIKTASTSGGIAGASWSTEFTNPNGSDITGVTAAAFIQFRITLSTSDIAITPYLFSANSELFKMNYSKAGVSPESSILSVWQSGWKDFGVQSYKKFIHRIKVFYTGSEGTMTFNYRNDESDVNNSFTINLAQDPDTNTKTYNYDAYTGDDTNKIFTFYPPANSTTTPSPIGQFFMFKISEPGNVGWTVNKVEVQYTPEELYE